MSIDDALVMILAGTLLALLVFVFSFLAVCRTEGSIMGTSYVSRVYGIIWGAYKSKTVSGGDTNIHTFDKAYPASVLPLIGVILVLVGGLGACVMALLGSKLFKDEKIAKIVLFVCAGLMVLGGVFHFFINSAFADVMVKEANSEYFTKQDALDMLKEEKASYALVIISGVLAVLGGASVAASQFVPEKQLVK